MSDVGVLALVKFEYSDKSGWKVRPGLITGEYLNDYQVTFITKAVDKYKNETTSIIIGNEDFSAGRLKKRSIVRTHKTFWIEKSQCKKVGTLKMQARTVQNKGGSNVLSRKSHKRFKTVKITVR